MSGLEIRRLYYSTKDVSEITQVHPNSLRAWEKQFPYPRPVKNKKGRRLYRPNDLKAVEIIKKLKDEGYADERIAHLFKHYSMHELTEMDLMSDRVRLHRIMLLTEMLTDLKEILHML